MSDTSEPTLAQRIAAVMGDMQGIGKNQTNSAQGWKFRGIEDITLVMRPLLAKHGIVCLPDHREAEVRDVTTAKGGHAQEARICTRWTVTDGRTELVAITWGQAIDTGDKALNKAMTASFKYLLLQVFCVSDADDDPDPSTVERGEDPAVKLRSRLAALLREQGLDREASAARISELVGRTVARSTELSVDELGFAIHLLEGGE